MVKYILQLCLFVEIVYHLLFADLLNLWRQLDAIAGGLPLSLVDTNQAASTHLNLFYLAGL